MLTVIDLVPHVSVSLATAGVNSHVSHQKVERQIAKQSF